MFDFFASAEFLVTLGTLLVGIAGAVAGQHPAVAGVLATLGARLRGGSRPRKPPTSLLLVAALTGLVLAGDAQAGPIVERVRERRAERQQRFAPPVSRPACVCADSCACAPGVCPQRCPVVKPAVGVPVFPYALPPRGCPDGKCPLARPPF